MSPYCLCVVAHMLAPLETDQAVEAIVVHLQLRCHAAPIHAFSHLWFPQIGQ
jgi:hypothetical protein